MLKLKRRNVFGGIAVCLLYVLISIYDGLRGVTGDDIVNETISPEKTYSEQQTERRLTGSQISTSELQKEQQKIQYRNPVPEQRKVVFIKTFKAASESIQSMLMRFGFRRHLSFALPRRNKMYLGWPFRFRTKYAQVWSGKWKPMRKTRADIEGPPAAEVESERYIGDIVTGHSVLSKEMLERFPRPAYKYITSLREPWSHLLSTFAYYNLEGILPEAFAAKMKRLNLRQRAQNGAGPGSTPPAASSGRGELSSSIEFPFDTSDPIRSYLKNLDILEPLYMSKDAAPKRFCVPDGHSMLRNLQSFSIGIQPKFTPGSKELSLSLVDNFNFKSDTSSDKEANIREDVNDRIAQKQEEQGENKLRASIANLPIDFAIIMERMDESLVLLRRKFGWITRDVLMPALKNTLQEGVAVTATNAGKYQEMKKLVRDPEIESIYRNISRADYLLYEHFMEKLNKEIEAEGPSFAEEVAQYRELKQRAKGFCEEVRKKPVDHTVTSLELGFDIIVDAQFCHDAEELSIEEAQQREAKRCLDAGLSRCIPAREPPPLEEGHQFFC